MGADAPTYRERVETKEYEAQFDMLVAKYSAEVLENALLGVLWGISTNPEEFGRPFGHIYSAKTSSHSSEMPDFRIYYSVESEGRVLMLWIEEVGDGAM